MRVVLRQAQAFMRLTGAYFIREHVVAIKDVPSWICHRWRVTKGVYWAEFDLVFGRPSDAVPKEAASELSSSVIFPLETTAGFLR